jgi:hypothetical protein
VCVLRAEEMGIGAFVTEAAADAQLGVVEWPIRPTPGAS